ncbi:hypothetical protein QN277_010649 [Acacia crassicarpa]|uniref:F-box domain-containing protein n=1 Tax=Acacia crassicarpa TaxID=499986 RepID=A0AAE1IM35_9FABA|nr:hypothetical protein QN277_010649 [Acacia crassicarpa]
MFGDLPPEILGEILHRLPVKSLVKCTIVCKYLNSFITDQTFIFDHLNQTIQASSGNGWLFLQLYHQRPIRYEEFYSLYSHNQQIGHFSVNKFPLSSLLQSFDHSTVVGTCDGLVCITNSQIHDMATLLIWNPSIRKYMLISEPILTSGTGNGQHEGYQPLYGFGFDSKNKDFKVIRLVTLYCSKRKRLETLLRKENVPQVEVFSLASRSWRSIPFRASPFLLPDLFWNIPQVFLNGVVHWVVSRRCDNHIVNIILTFDVAEETFGELTLPQQLRESTTELSILQGGDSLCVLHAFYVEDDCFFSIWVMKEYGVVGSWNEVYCWDSHLYQGITNVLALCADGKVVLLLYSGDVVLLNPVTEVVKSLTGQKWFYAFVGSYVESLVFIKREPDVLSY